MEEKEYLRAGNVLVTSTRIEINGQTFAVRNIGSVKVMRPGTPWFAALLLIGSLMAAFGGKSYGSLLITAACAAWIWQQVTQRRLILVSGGGETLALKSNNGSHVESIRSAISQAISAR